MEAADDLKTVGLVVALAAVHCVRAGEHQFVHQIYVLVSLLMARPARLRKSCAKRNTCKDGDGSSLKLRAPGREVRDRRID